MKKYDFNTKNKTKWSIYKLIGFSGKLNKPKQYQRILDGAM